MREKIKQDLYNLADKKYQKFHSSLCPGINNFIGIRVPVLRKYAKELIKEYSISEILNDIDDELYEEIMLQAMVIGLSKDGFEEKKGYIEEFIPKIDNWAICDVFCAGLKPKKNELSLVWKFIKKYLKSKKEYELRFSIVMMLDYFIIDEYIESVIEEIDKIKVDKYYVQMAIAWCLSICYIKYPKETMRYLKNNNLDDFTYNKAIQKIRESYRVSKEEKEILNKMKR